MSLSTILVPGPSLYLLPLEIHLTFKEFKEAKQKNAYLFIPHLLSTPYVSDSVTYWGYEIDQIDKFSVRSLHCSRINSKIKKQKC